MSIKLAQYFRIIYIRDHQQSIRNRITIGQIKAIIEECLEKATTILKKLKLDI